MTISTGSVLQSRYRILRPLGQGGMGSVFLAEDLHLSRPCALKENLPDPAASPQALAQARAQFQTEAQTLANLDHPSLPNVTDFFSDGGSEFLVMEYVEGQNLADVLDDHLQRFGLPLPEKPVLIWIGQVLDALSYLHQQRPFPVIHRDIKPANIILGAGGRVKLVDFGLVKLFDHASPGTATAMRGMGTPPYAPLEQYGSRLGHTDARSDLYALGATLYHLLAGTPPPDVHELLLGQCRLVPLGEANPAVSAATEAAVSQALEIYPDRRFQTARQMRQALPIPAAAPPLQPPALTAAATVRVPAAPASVAVVPPAPGSPPVAVQRSPAPADPTPTAGSGPAVPSLANLPGARPAPQGSWLAKHTDLAMATVALGFLVLLIVIAGSQHAASPPAAPGAAAGSTAGGPRFPVGVETYLAVAYSDKSEVYALRTGDKLQQYSHTPGSAGSWAPASAPDGSLYFTSDRDGKQEIYRLDSTGLELRYTNTPGSAGSWSPAVGPTGVLYFVSDREGKRNLYALDGRGKVLRLTAPPGDAEDWDPTVADSGTVYFTSTRTGKREVYAITERGTVLAYTHTPGAAESWGPCATTDGSVFFTSNRAGKREIYRLDAAGQVLRFTNTAQGAESWGALRGQDAQIYFISNRWVKPEIVALENGGRTRRLTYLGQYGATGIWAEE